LENEEAVALLMPIRAPAQHARVAEARRQAMALYRALLPTFVASLPEEGV
jgi:hypothetical protein